MDVVMTLWATPEAHVIVWLLGWVLGCMIGLALASVASS